MGSEDGLDPWFVTGFIDGEGIFTYNRSRSQLAVVFALRLAASDRELLGSIRKFFGGVGREYLAPKRAPTRNAGRTRSSCYLKVTRPPELLRIVRHFDSYPLQGEKRHVYAIWREMVFVRAAYHGSRPPQELNELARRLSQTVPRNRPWT